MPELGLEGVSIGLLGTVLLLGLRHGIDWDHIAAITDLASSQPSRRRSFWLSALYALGHASVVFLLGMLAIVSGDVLPDAVDRILEPVVGATLVMLGAYVLISLARDGREFKMRSRWMLVLHGARKLFRDRPQGHGPLIEIEHEHEHRVGAAHGHHHPQPEIPHVGGVGLKTKTHSHRHRHTVPMPDDPFVEYGPLTSFGIGMLHGVGAETPTQILLFVTASRVGGTFAGVVLLMTFIVGVLISNSAIAMASSFGFSRTENVWPLYAGIAIFTAIFSLGLGVLYLFGGSSLLPSLLT